MSTVFPQTPKQIMEHIPFKIELITVTTSGTGAASAVSDPIIGEIKKIVYVKGTVNASTTAVVASTGTLGSATTVSEAIDNFDVNSAVAANHYIGSGILLYDTVTVTVTGGAASKTFYVYIFYR